MHARVAGVIEPAESPPVVLIHGAGVSSRYMSPLLECLAPFCLALAPDLPGFGSSDKPAHAPSLAELASDLRAWLDAASLGPVVLAGNSFGCQIIVELLAGEPRGVAAAVLQGPTVEAGARTAPEQLRRWLVNSRREPLSLAPIIVRDYLSCGLARALKTFGVALADRMEEKLPNINVPVLVLRGESDRIVSQRWAERVAGLLPHSRIETVAGAHTLNYSAPHLVAESILRFVASGSAP